MVQDFKPLRQEMQAHPVQNILFGSLGLSRWYHGQFRQGERDERGFRPDVPGGPPDPEHRDHPPAPPQRAGLIGLITFFSRIGAALLLAIVTGAWLSRKFTRPLASLERGAQAFHSGQV